MEDRKEDTENIYQRLGLTYLNLSLQTLQFGLCKKQFSEQKISESGRISKE